MLSERVVGIADYDGDDRCQHEYAGLREQCTNSATKLVSFQNDMGELSLPLCSEHADKFQDE